MKKHTFTFVELMVVIVIIGILGAVSVNSLMSINGRNLKNEIYGIMSDLWYLRQKAMAAHNDLQLRFYTGGTIDSYCLCKGACPGAAANCLYMTTANVIAPKRTFISSIDAIAPITVNANAVNGTFIVFPSGNNVIQLDMGTRHANLTVYNGTGYVQEKF